MGELRNPNFVQPLAGLLADSQEMLERAGEALRRKFGPVQAVSQSVPFKHSDYYAGEMGADLLRQFVVFVELQSPDELADWKTASNLLERELGLNERNGRRVNIDPGYLAPGKLVLASTKDHEHRIYLRKGIFAEVTLRIRDGRFQPWDWTYPDYREAIPFFYSAYVEYLQVLTRRREMASARESRRGAAS